MNRYNRTIQAAGVPLALIIGLLLLIFVPAGASAAPQGPWVLPPGNLTASGKSATSPQVAHALDGSTTVVWVRSGTVQAKTRPVGGSFGPTVDVSTPGMHASDPQIAIAPDGSATVVWQQITGSSRSNTGYTIQAATRPWGGAFGTPVNISKPGQNAYTPQIANAANGSTTVVWRRSNGSKHIIQAATRPPGGVFGTAVDLSDAGQDADQPRIAIASDGSTTVVWQLDVISNYTNSSYIIQASTRLPGGSFGTPVNLSGSAPDEFAKQPQIAIGPDGSATVVWQQVSGSKSSLPNISIQAATRSSKGVFGAPVDVTVPGAFGRFAEKPQIAIARNGNATVVWRLFNGKNWIIQASTRPPGGSFGAPVGISGSQPGEIADEPQIAIAGDGSTTVVWKRAISTWKPSTSTNWIIEASTRPAGKIFRPLVVLSAGGQDADNPQIAIARDGGTTVVWQRQYNGVDSIIQSVSTVQPPVIKVQRSRIDHGRSFNPYGSRCSGTCRARNPRGRYKGRLPAAPLPRR